MHYFQDWTKSQRALLWRAPQVVARTDQHLFAAALGANLYMSGLLDLYTTIVRKKTRTQTVTICFEDAIQASDVPRCEAELMHFLSQLATEQQVVTNLPAIFIRVRSVQQFQTLTQQLTRAQLQYVSGFVFPKVTLANVQAYLTTLQVLADKHDLTLYAMPIFETAELMYHETREEQFSGLAQVLANHRELILNIRLGGADFSALFGLRRPVTTTIHDLGVVKEAFTAIFNRFGRMSEGYVISGPVWEYFAPTLASAECQGLIREVQLDLANGYIGKTAIHPTQVDIINASHIVTYEAYQDACALLGQNADSGVFKGAGGNKMNEIGPHHAWALKTLRMAHIFGVLQPGVSHADVYAMLEVEHGN